jgi:fructuronate reductase
MEALLTEDPRWGICGVSLRSADVRDALAPQDGLYTLAVLGDSPSLQVIGALKELRVAPEDPQAVLRRMTAADTRLITITVTEKGYCLGPDGELDFAHAEIQRDLRTPEQPNSLIGYLVEGLARRRATGTRPVTVVSCDNLADNGARLARAVVRMAQSRDSGLASWIAAEVPFPNTMVDSITPASTDALKRNVSAAIGLADRWPVQREVFSQWVLENRCCAGAPDWASVGVTLTDDVAGYARAKLRLLNGAHSAIAYLGLLAAHKTVADAMTDTALAEFVQLLMSEDVAPSVNPPQGLDLAAYCRSILRRFRNTAVRHELAQIAWDGSQKIPIRLLPSVAAAIAGARPVGRLCTAVAAWMHFVRRAAVRCERITDPMSDQLLAIGRACGGGAAADVRKFLTLDTVFPRNLVAEPRFTAAVDRAYDLLSTVGESDGYGRLLR